MSAYEAWSLVVAILAALVAAVAIVVAMRANRYSKRQAEASTTTERLALEAAKRGRVVFRLTDRGDQEFELRNEGTDSAYGVKVDCGDIVGRGKPEIPTFKPGEVERYFFIRTLSSSDEKAIVTWHHLPDESDEPQHREFLV